MGRLAGAGRRAGAGREEEGRACLPSSCSLPAIFSLLCYILSLSCIRKAPSFACLSHLLKRQGRACMPACLPTSAFPSSHLLQGQGRGTYAISPPVCYPASYLSGRHFHLCLPATAYSMRAGQANWAGAGYALPHYLRACLPAIHTLTPPLHTPPTCTPLPCLLPLGRQEPPRCLCTPHLALSHLTSSSSLFASSCLPVPFLKEGREKEHSVLYVILPRHLFVFAGPGGLEDMASVLFHTCLHHIGKAEEGRKRKRHTSLAAAATLTLPASHLCRCLLPLRCLCTSFTCLSFLLTCLPTPLPSPPVSWFSFFVCILPVAGQENDTARTSCLHACCGAWHHCLCARAHPLLPLCCAACACLHMPASCIFKQHSHLRRRASLPAARTACLPCLISPLFLPAAACLSSSLHCCLSRISSHLCTCFAGMLCTCCFCRWEWDGGLDFLARALSYAASVPSVCSLRAYMYASFRASLRSSFAYIFCAYLHLFFIVAF